MEILDRISDPALDELVQFAAMLGKADYAYLGSIDGNRLCFLSQFGFKAQEQPLSATACGWMLEKGEPLLIEDARQFTSQFASQVASQVASQAPRFPPAGIPLIDAQPCRSYAGVPLRSNSDQIVGTLAILAREAARFSLEQITVLEILGRQIVTRLELYARIRVQEQAQRSRQRIERALAIERCFVAATLDSIPALIAVLDTAGRTVRMNQSCAQLTGLSFADAVGRPFIDEVLQTEEQPWAHGRLRDAAAGQVSGPHETEWRVVGGLGRRVSWTLRPLEGPDGEIQYLIVSGQDVTDQRKVETALHSSEARYREVVENSLGFVFTCSLEGRLTSLNSFTAETLGYRAGALNGRFVTELLDAAGLAAFQDCLRALAKQEEWQGALPLRRSDGAFRRIACRSRRMQLPGERPFILIYGTDVTEQHEAEQALRMATRQRELILDSVGDGIYGIDLEGRLTFINQAGAQSLGYTPEQLIGRDLHEVVHHSNADGTPYSKSTNPILQALRSGEPIRMRDEIFWRDGGTAVPVEYSANPLMENGLISGMVVAFQDISERRRLENMKDEFISTVSHELRTPLTSLRASLGLISSGSLDDRPEKQGQMLTMAIANSDRLIRLVNDILDFENVDKRQVFFDRRSVEAMDLLRCAADAAQNTAAQAHIRLSVEAAPAQAMADEERIRQVLNELIGNAIKFSPPESTIRLSAQPINEGVEDSPAVCFTVEDQGRGIAPENLERIFERFQQGDASDSRALGGTGLGLALCRSIVEQHGGRIWADSAPGQGSRFHFTLPAATQGAS
jgi:two-component system sensor histidine kinase VicK